MLNPKTAVTLGAVAAVGSVALLISCATVNRVVVAPPMIAGATYVGMETCATCHEKEVRDFKLTSHSRIQLRVPEDAAVEGLGCEACHGPGSLHVEAGGGRGVHVINPGDKPDACFQCHLEQNVQFSLRNHHPVKEGKMSCQACHNPHGEDIHQPNGAFMARVNDTCAQCHREQTRPRVFEHEAMREGCTACHNAHGSINDKMLTERDSNLCLKCHAQVALPATPGQTFIGKFDHSAFLGRGTCFSAGCHTAVHGSDVNSHLRY